LVLRFREPSDFVALQLRMYKEYEQQLSTELPTYFVVHEEREFAFWSKLLPREKLLCVINPRDLLQLYARTNKMISLRVHASVVALGFGKEVCNIGMDSRSNILEAVGVKSLPMIKFELGSSPVFETCPNIDQIKSSTEERFKEDISNGN